MQEKIYTIPVNEAFEQSEGNCPFCLLFRRLEENELELILGASMMEPDTRIKTNKQGFCPSHYNKMFGRKNRLGLALMLESHLDELAKDLKPGGLLTRDPAAKVADRIEKLDNTCYVCTRIEDNFSKMLSTAAYLYDNNPAFVDKFNAQSMFCLPHFKRMLQAAQNTLPRKKQQQFFDEAYRVMNGYMTELRGDVSWFCKKFDYRFDNEPWGNSKTAVARAIKFLSGPDGDEIE